MNNLEKISKSVYEIRQHLGAECVDVLELPPLVEELVKDSSKNGFTTALVCSTESYPNRPTSSSLDPATGLVSDLDEEWFQTSASNKVKSVESNA